MTVCVPKGIHTHNSITVYTTSPTTVPSTVANIPITHTIIRADDFTDKYPAHLHHAIDNGAPVLVWGRSSSVEMMTTSLKQTHHDLESREINVYVRPAEKLKQSPYLFAQKKAALLGRAEALLPTTTQVVVAAEEEVPEDDGVPWPVIDWYLSDGTRLQQAKGVLVLGEWPSLVGHIQLYLPDPPELVLGHSGATPAEDVREKVTQAIQDFVLPHLLPHLRRYWRECAASGRATWLPAEEAGWRREREHLDELAAARRARAEVQARIRAQRQVERAKEAKETAKKPKPKKKKPVVKVEGELEEEQPGEEEEEESPPEGEGVEADPDNPDAVWDLPALPRSEYVIPDDAEPEEGDPIGAEQADDPDNNGQRTGTGGQEPVGPIPVPPRPPSERSVSSMGAVSSGDVSQTYTSQQMPPPPSPRATGKRALGHGLGRPPPGQAPLREAIPPGEGSSEESDPQPAAKAAKGAAAKPKPFRSVAEAKLAAYQQNLDRRAAGKKSPLKKGAGE